MPLTLDAILERTDAAHKAIHKHPFNKTKKKSTTVLPYLRKHEQMYWIYLALEQKYGHIAHAFPPLQDDSFQELFERSRYIQQDIQFMRARLGQPVDAPIPRLESTKALIKEIEGATPHQWLGLFLVRILADLNGGQFVRSRLNKMFGSPAYWQMMLVSLEIVKRSLCQNRWLVSCVDQLIDAAQASQGTAAYRFPSGVKASLEDILPKLANGDGQVEKILASSNQCFGFLSNIFTELHDMRSVSTQVSQEVGFESVKLKAN